MVRPTPSLLQAGYSAHCPSFHHIGPQEQTVSRIKDFEKLFLAPGFLAYISVLIIASLVIVFYFAPK